MVLVRSVSSTDAKAIKPRANKGLVTGAKLGFKHTFFVLLLEYTTDAQCQGAVTGSSRSGVRDGPWLFVTGLTIYRLNTHDKRRCCPQPTANPIACFYREFVTITSTVKNILGPGSNCNCCPTFLVISSRKLGVRSIIGDQ